MHGLRSSPHPAVTRAALRVGLTQPATSHALTRLRGLFNDQLFVRTPKGMVPTTLAEEMANEVELIAGNFPEPPAHMSEELLCLEEYVCAGRGDHPCFNDNLSVEAYLALRHLHVSLKGEPQGYLDDIIRSQGLRRQVVVTVGHFLLAPFLLSSTDAVATEPRRIMEPLGKLLNLKLIPPPIDIPPFEVTQVWHKRHDPDRGHTWLRDLIREVSANLNHSG